MLCSCWCGFLGDSSDVAFILNLFLLFHAQRDAIGQTVLADRATFPISGKTAIYFQL